MFLMMGWAIVSDCDINSEVIRWIGPARFTIWGVYRVLFLRHYPATLTYKGFRLNSKDHRIPLEEYKEETMEIDFKHLTIHNTPWISTEMNIAPMSLINDGTNDITAVTGDKSRIALAKMLIQQDNGDYFHGEE